MSKEGGRTDRERDRDHLENSGTFETRGVTFNAGGWSAMQKRTWTQVLADLLEENDVDDDYEAAIEEARAARRAAGDAAAQARAAWLAEHGQEERAEEEECIPLPVYGPRQRIGDRLRAAREEKESQRKQDFADQRRSMDSSEGRTTAKLQRPEMPQLTATRDGGPKIHVCEHGEGDVGDRETRRKSSKLGANRSDQLNAASLRSSWTDLRSDTEGDETNMMQKGQLGTKGKGKGKKAALERQAVEDYDELLTAAEQMEDDDYEDRLEHVHLRAGSTADCDHLYAPGLADRPAPNDTWPTPQDLEQTMQAMDIHDTDSEGELLEVSEGVFEWVSHATIPMSWLPLAQTLPSAEAAEAELAAELSPMTTRGPVPSIGRAHMEAQQRYAIAGRKTYSGELPPAKRSNSQAAASSAGPSASSPGYAKEFSNAWYRQQEEVHRSAAQPAGPRISSPGYVRESSNAWYRQQEEAQQTATASDPDHVPRIRDPPGHAEGDPPGHADEVDDESLMQASRGEHVQKHLLVQVSFANRADCLEECDSAHSPPGAANQKPCWLALAAVVFATGGRAAEPGQVVECPFCPLWLR